MCQNLPFLHKTLVETQQINKEFWKNKLIRRISAASCWYV